MPKTKQQWKNWVRISNKMGRAMLKNFPNADPKLKAKWKPVKISDYRWDKDTQEYVKKSGWKKYQRLKKEGKV